jgi:hypothetical protein
MPGIRGERNLRPAAPVRLKGPFGTIIGSPMANVLASKKAQEEAESADSFGGLGGLLGTILGFAAGGPAGAGIGSAIGGAAGGLASSPGRSGQLPIQIPGATGMGAALLGQDEPPEAPGWQQAAGIANMALGPLLSSVGSQAAPPPVDPMSLAPGAGGPPSMSQWGGYQQPSALPMSVPQPLPQTRVSPSLFPGGSNFVPAGTMQPPPQQPLPWQQPPAQRQQPFQQSPMVAQNAFPRAPSGMIPGALANFSVSDLLNPNVQTPDITELIQQQILAGMV